RTESAANGTFTFTRLEAGSYRIVLELGSMADSPTVLNAGNRPVVLARGVKLHAEVRVGSSATPATVAEARAMEAGTRVIISGVTLNASSVFGDSTLHVQDATAAIRVLRVRDAVAAGDSVRVIGTVGLAGGQP